ncbi:MAG: T9SS type A sorting domain-containing protein [Bacteroidales bacterium]|nr:T9SS type A sorting domain-containing protein [Bacteroidales bacterium]
MRHFFTKLIALIISFSPLMMSAQIVDRDLTNLVIFMRFADDAEITHSFPSIDTMFNGKTPGYLSVANFYNTMTYGHINYNTVYTNNIQNNQIVSYQDEMPRGYFEPYGPSNPIGYQGELPFMGICRREAELLARAFDYVNTNHLVDDDVVLDGDGDGYIDNVSFVVKGGTGEWASILWPHMEYFPHDSIDHPVVVNGIRPNTFNLEFEGAPTYFTAHVFRHEMGHSLNLPDLYHYINYTNVSPAGSWDMMCYNYGTNHTAAIYKNKILHVCDEPIEITESGDYTLNSVGSSQSQNCYYIKSAIDSTQWFVLEYRNRADLFDEDIPGTGLIIARWNDTVTLDYNGMFANAFFDNDKIANQYWIFRPGSSSDIQNGNINNAHFSHATGRTSFGPDTNPHPYLTDGTPEVSFEITDIQENGPQLTFHVHFFDDGVDDNPFEESLAVYPNPATDRLFVNGNNLQQVELFNTLGQCVLTKVADNESLTEVSIDGLPSGMYLLRITTNRGETEAKKVLKK